MLPRLLFLQNLNLSLFFSSFKQVQNKEVNTLELSNEVLFSKAKLNHVNTKATKVSFSVKKTNIVFPLISATPLGIHVEISASPLICATPLNAVLIRIVTIFY